ncbi:MAG: hypothetical protein A3F87_00555 [Omnitrophica WOR_2 bacterium RIFCSPLOWO2_12_FULL_51_24]|nr:MAG: hypothetical protein A2879_04345 [Omnitrophica WOR_2 bacterium RIFCSPHIGHO2_01_FULL_49_10]OGX42941.1 MAG: hypothetical protein A3F87_00555 [Omnitrophica WOR_2 bacterium RIFCSPLOWO2_12_FULL_51_24]
MADNIIKDSDRAKEHAKHLQDAMKTFFQFEIGFEETLKVSLKDVLEDVDVDAVFVYLYDEPTDSLECVQARVREKGVVAGESRIPITHNADDLISLVFLGKKDYEIWGDGFQVCVALRSEEGNIGVLIADKLTTRTKITLEEKELLTDYAHQFNRGIRYIKIFQANRRKIEMLLALAKISEAMATAMELEPVLAIILKNVVQILGFDRAKLYLIDNENKLLRGRLSADIRSEAVRPIANEQYPLQKGVNRVVDSLLEENPDGSRAESGTKKLLLYVPLAGKKTKIGMLVVDNVFSRQPITDEDIDNLNILANQAAVSIEKTRLYEEVKELSIRDSLTGLYVHGYFLDRLEQEVEKSSHDKGRFSLLIVDIDGFKKYNDRYGHQTGDKILKILSDILKQNIRSFGSKGRPTDAIGRYGGDEFVIMLTSIPREPAQVVAKRLQDVVRHQRVVVDNRETTFTVSIGIALFPEDGADQVSLFKKADEALYWAKQHGKDQICMVKDIGKKG